MEECISVLEKRDQRINRAKEIFSSILRSSLIPNSETFTYLFRSCYIPSLSEESPSKLIEIDIYAGRLPKEVQEFEGFLTCDATLAVTEPSLRELIRVLVQYQSYQKISFLLDSQFLPKRTLQFYSELIQILSRQPKTASFALNEVYYQMKRDFPKPQLWSSETWLGLVECSLTIRKTEWAYKLWEDCLATGKVPRSLFEKMQIVWGEKVHFAKTDELKELEEEGVLVFI
jgi:hypothetical protein